ncbi:MAG TPA: YciI family protein [Kiloniellaceae bacterium]|nr:YciI family protein [Kiloniellaceae bacterium]
MLYAVLFEDNETQAEMRTQHMAAHLAFLAAHADRIRSAGPLREAASGAPAGGLWLVEASDAAAVQALIEADPFWPTGLRKSQRILGWRQVFAEGQRLI